MVQTRSTRAKLNILVSFGTQIVTLICGLIIPKAMISAFGSETYGATASIAQFLSYIALLEGGIGGVARAALYKPLAENNKNGISEVVCEIKRLFRIVAYIFVAYVLVLACCFKKISEVKSLEWTTSFLLVLVISISTFAQYFIGISYSVLLQAAQKTYITHLISVFATVFNAALTVILINLDFNILIVKLGSACVFVLRPILMWLYVRKQYGKLTCKTRNKNLLSQKWSGMGQHLAYFLHSHTDIAILTLCSELKLVSVYSIYNMVVAQIQTFTSSFSTGMEALFGDMLAKKEHKQLDRTFTLYDSLISFVSVVLFSAVLVLIVPFVKLYTKGINDANYIYPFFAVILTLSSFIYCLRMPYHSVIISAGHFKQTRAAAYGEALINIVLSLILVNKFGLNGVAIGTLAATMFRFGFYVVYLSKHIINRSLIHFVKRFSVNSVAVAASTLLCYFLSRKIKINNYLEWATFAALTMVVIIVVTSALYLIFYKKDVGFIFGKILKKRTK